MNTSRSAINTFLFLTLLMLVTSAEVQGQYTRTADRGFQPSSSYAVGDFETINTSNGNVMLNIPLAGLPAGRGGLGAKVNLVYDSKLYNTNTTYSNCPAVPAGAGLLPRTPPYPGCGGDPGFPSELVAFSTEGGWRYNFKYTLREIRSSYDGHVSCNPQQPTTVDIIKMQVVYPDGSTHDFRLRGYSEPDPMQPNYFPIDSSGTATPNSYCQGYSNTTNNLVYYSVDGTYARLEVEHGTLAWTLYLPDGSRVTSPTASQGQRIYDRNNNYIEIVTTGFNYNGNPASKIFDQLGRQVIIENIASTNTDLIHAWGVGNQELIWTVKWKTISINKSYHSGWGGLVSIPSFQKNRRVVDQIILPAVAGQAAQAYTFGYNAGTANPSLGWGEVSSITTPTGAQVSYIWAMDGVNGSSAIAADVLKNSLVRKDLSYLAEFDGSSSLVTDQWFYSVNQDSGVTQITGPNTGVTTEHFLPGETKGFKTERPDGSVVERIWANNQPYGYPQGDANNIVKTEFTSIRDAAGNLSKTVIVDYKYDKNGNVTQTTEYDWVDWYTVPRDSAGKPTGIIPGGAVINRVSVNDYYNQTADSADTTTNDPNSYTYLTAPPLLRALSSTEIKWGNASDGSQTLSRSEFTYDNANTTGNVTQQKSWDSTKGAYSNPLGTNSISVSTQYNSYGSPTLTTDARGYQTQIHYGTVGGFTDLYPTQIKTAYLTSVQRTETREYDFYTGVVARVTDVDNNVYTLTSYDVFGRPTVVRAAADKLEETRTTTEYSDVNRRVIQRSDLNAVGDGKLVSVQHYDQLGRVRLSRQLEDSLSQSAEDETAGIKVQTRYINSGENSYQLVSNPYRAAYSSSAGSEATMGWSRSKSDKGGRVLEVQNFSGAGLPAPWGSNGSHTGIVSTSYDAEFTTATDQAGKTRRSKLDGLGRLIRVDEPDSSGNLGTISAPTQPTSYVYDVAGNLKTVTQGAQERTFVYDSLKRLTSAINPESGTVSYTYDDHGNLLTKTDARGVVSNYTYDPLNRNTSVRYTNNALYTHWVDRYYDGETVPNGKGRLWKTVATEIGVAGRGAVVLGTSTRIVNEYDGLGKVVSGAQITDDQTYSMSYSYNRAGSQTSMTYPSGRTVTTEFESASRMAGVRDQQDGTYYAGAAATDATNRMQYAAHGALSVMKLGNGLWEHTNFNSRLQPLEIGLGTSSSNSSTLSLSYDYGSANNNGNVLSVSYSGGGLSYTQTFGYDTLNRLTTSAEGSSWSQTNTYDRYGNRAIDLGGGNQSLTFNTANNRITNAGYVYDAVGNLTNDGVHSYGFDGENRIKSVDWVTDVYRYDGDGNRIRKNFATGEKIRMVYSGGQLIAEYDLSSGALLKEYVYGGKGLIATVEPGAGTKYTTADHLGTPRVVTDSSGTVVSRHDYRPFGEEISAGVGARSTGMGYSAADGVRQKFTQKERDNETGLDYFVARYFSSTQGRFTGVDPALIKKRHLINPQDLNRYSYVANNPLAFIDPDGEEKVTIIIRTFIPQKQVMTPAGRLKGDGRDVGDKGTNRTEFSITVETNINKDGGRIISNTQRRAGMSEGPTLTPTYVPGVGTVPIPGYGKSQATDLENKMQAVANRPLRDTVEVTATHAVAYPGMPGTPDIDYNLNIQVVDIRGRISMSVEGMHDGFPGLEVYGVREGSNQEQLINSYDPRDAGAGPRALIGNPDTKLKRQTKELERDR